MLFFIFHCRQDKEFGAYVMSDSESIKAQLANVAGNTSGTHKEQADRYRVILTQILAGSSSDIATNLKALVDQSQYQ